MTRTQQEITFRTARNDFNYVSWICCMVSIPSYASQSTCETLTPNSALTSLLLPPRGLAYCSMFFPPTTLEHSWFNKKYCRFAWDAAWRSTWCVAVTLMPCMLMFMRMDTWHFSVRCVFFHLLQRNMLSPKMCGTTCAFRGHNQTHKSESLSE